jgi:predicted nuclease of predicted toxin-antitoxin system
MRFLLDAQLPRRLCKRLREHGHDAIHTLDLPQGNRTPDSVINRLSIAEGRVVVTKDSDFVDSLIVRAEPHKLLLVSTGNIGNSQLEELFLQHLEAIVAGLEEHHFVEVDHLALRLHF